MSRVCTANVSYIFSVEGDAFRNRISLQIKYEAMNQR